jgi:3-hydroxymyristoyl/3-hydroxydecanoyl-(acyl carrier protein) dehydratase
MWSRSWNRSNRRRKSGVRRPCRRSSVESGGVATALQNDITMSWLAALPHQIPFRAASSVIDRSEKSIVGKFLWTANETLTPEVMLVEAMAQFAGGLVFEAQGFISGIDNCEVTRAIEPGDVVIVDVSIDADFGRIFRFSGTASIDGVEIARGRFYLASSDAQT